MRATTDFYKLRTCLVSCKVRIVYSQYGRIIFLDICKFKMKNLFAWGKFLGKIGGLSLSHGIKGSWVRAELLNVMSVIKMVNFRWILCSDFALETGLNSKKLCFKPMVWFWKEKSLIIDKFLLLHQQLCGERNGYVLHPFSPSRIISELKKENIGCLGLSKEFLILGEIFIFIWIFVES